MRRMKKRVFALFAGFLLLLLSACSPGATGTATPATAPAHSATAPAATSTPTLVLTPTPPPALTPAPALTPTPLIYKVQENDTLTYIASRYALTPAELLTANPNLNPDLLTIGDELVIPVSAGYLQTLTAPTAGGETVELGDPTCVLSAGGGYHCYALARNVSGAALYDLIAEFTLTDPQGVELVSKAVPLPLKTLGAGQSLPFYVYFAPPIEPGFSVNVELAGMSRAVDKNTAAVPLVIGEVTTRGTDNGLTVAVEGTASHNAESPLEALRLVAVAYNSGGEVVGLRILEEEHELAANVDWAFSLQVYSTGGVIDRVEVVGEGTK